MRPNLLFEDANAGPNGPKVYKIATGEKRVSQGAANFTFAPDSWVAAKDLKSKFDVFLPFRRKVVRRRYCVGTCECR
jgi:hypothetical protein